MSDDKNIPYANLDPDLILTAIESVGYACSGSLFALNSYENRVYQVGIEDETPVIAKFYRPHRWSDAAILEEHEFAAELISHEIPVVAPLSSHNATLHHYKDFRFALFPRRGGRPLEPDNLDQLEWMGRFIGRLHAVSATHPFQHRPTLDINTHGFNAYHFLLQNHFIPDYLIARFSTCVEAMLKQVAQLYLAVPDLKLIRLHGDCHIGNVLWNDAGPHIVDLDDCVMGPAVQDIWMMLSGDTAMVNLQLDLILTGYNEFHDFNPREIYLVEALRSLRMLQFAAWLANRWQDPAFPKGFPWFNTPHYWEELIQNLEQQIIVMENTSLTLPFGW